MIITTIRETKRHININLNGERLIECDLTKYLGITIQATLQ